MRYAIGIEYNGSSFCGWQEQSNGPSVQAELERAIARVADQQVKVLGAGRTDTGVHAHCQVAHFDSGAARESRQWVLGVNTHLPESICLLWARKVSDDFHARFSAVERSYRYSILNRWVRPALDTTRLAWCRKPLDAEAMHGAAACLEGEHDFSAFRSSGCQARHAVREITRVKVSRQGDLVHIDISANGFLYHMVRNIVGTLLLVGNREKPGNWMRRVLESRDRKQAGVTASSDGLYFVGVRYPAEFGIPEVEAFPAP
ncbi:MAG: tRNA pseudouridine(38-40) synthase TruA [Xanthomonadales bacterium]|nr:tRNA pseudouridine(38-40) synthase TruA [Xanthomonadales bacterium]